MEKSASANQWIFPHFNRLQQQYLIDNQIFEMLLVFKISFSVSSQHLKLPIILQIPILIPMQNTT